MGGWLSLEYVSDYLREQNTYGKVLKTVRELEVSNKENYLCSLDASFLSKQSNLISKSLKTPACIFSRKKFKIISVSWTLENYYNDISSI